MMKTVTQRIEQLEIAVVGNGDGHDYCLMKEVIDLKKQVKSLENQIEFIKGATDFIREGNFTKGKGWKE